jgi:peptidyl-prolyl cis-trans isomerase A (cyclophilin A)
MPSMPLPLVPHRAISRFAPLAAAATLAAGSADSAGSRVPDALLHPDPAALAAPAPDSFRAVFETSKGNFVVQVHRDWAPLGADRFYHLVRLGYFDDARFFRVISGFMAQFGLHGDPRVNAAWEALRIADDSVKQTNRRGTITFATAGPNTRTTQLFINYANNANLDAMGFAPIGEVVRGMEVVDALYAGYGEGPPGGRGPDQFRIGSEGNAYLTREFPQLDFVRHACIVRSGASCDES